VVQVHVTWQVSGPADGGARRWRAAVPGAAPQGLKRSTVVEAGGIPLGVVAAPANRRDDGLLATSLDTLGVVRVLPERMVVHLDAGYDYQTCRQALAERGMVGQIATRGLPAPIQTGRRWPVERTHAWGNQYGKLRWCTERRRLVVEFRLALANAAIVLVACSVAPGPATAGTADPAAAHDPAYWRRPLQAPIMWLARFSCGRRRSSASRRWR
jgi:hypothetical protein